MSDVIRAALAEAQKAPDVGTGIVAFLRRMGLRQIDYVDLRGNWSSEPGTHFIGAVERVVETDRYAWKGEGPPPPSWTAPDGTKVYRDYAAYVDD